MSLTLSAFVATPFSSVTFANDETAATDQSPYHAMLASSQTRLEEIDNKLKTITALLGEDLAAMNSRIDPGIEVMHGAINWTEDLVNGAGYGEYTVDQLLGEVEISDYLEVATRFTVEKGDTYLVSLNESSLRNILFWSGLVGALGSTAMGTRSAIGIINQLKQPGFFKKAKTVFRLPGLAIHLGTLLASGTVLVSQDTIVEFYMTKDDVYELLKNKSDLEDEKQKVEASIQRLNRRIREDARS